MKSSLAVGALALCLSVQAGFAMDPDEAGRQAHRELDALMAQQRSEKAAIEQPAAYSVPSPPSKANDRRAMKSLDGKVPTICQGC